jgi:hypothetical protein
MSRAFAGTPEGRKEKKTDGKRDDGVGQGKKAERAHPEDERGDGNEGVRGVEIASEEKPREERPETPPTERPFVKRAEIGVAPAARSEAQADDRNNNQGEDEEPYQDSSGEGMRRAARIRNGVSARTQNRR